MNAAAPPHSEPLAGATLRVRGLVQGVGFRPTVWRLARRYGIAGEVRNDGEGVLIHAVAAPARLEAFVVALHDEAPPLARVDHVEREPLATAVEYDGFCIVASGAGEVATGVVADAVVCEACLAEVLDPADRRHRYPFANCTHCGPRLSIVRAIPYDRASTSMAVFALCGRCRAEYEDPADRRFHAQPIACPDCGPRAWLEDCEGRALAAGADVDDVATAARLLCEGRIVAVKGLGGFHLACDARSEAAVSRLRAGKQRWHKPFALMARDLDAVRACAVVGEREALALRAHAAPVVILDRRAGAPPLAPGIAPGQDTLGFMLPCTPLHHLLLADVDGPLVFTSGNRSDEPQCTGNDEARERLAGIADAFLMHDRDIVNRLDDSVVRVMAGAPRVLRRARGLAPGTLALPAGFGDAPPVLAMGAELKNTFCLLRASGLVLAQHAGDLEDTRVHAAWREAIGLYRSLYHFEPACIAVDRHPDYLSTQWGRRLAGDEGRALVEVQHHHAHAAAVMLEHAVPLDAPPVLAVTLDGLGMGDGRELWGGEFLRCDYRGFERLASFQSMPLAGGARAMREPWRNALACLWRLFGLEQARRRWPWLAVFEIADRQGLTVLERMLESGLNTPEASSAGRLFDAVAAVLGVCTERAAYEGQAAIELETLAARAADRTGAYDFEWLEGAPPRIGWRPMWQALLDDLANGVARERIAARFHGGLVAAVADTGFRLAQAHDLERVVLGGGVFQNRLLVEGVHTALTARGLRVLLPAALPANDGGLSAGQAAVAAARMLTPAA